jgi:hypothetical protein
MAGAPDVSAIQLRPITLREARAFVAEHHRHVKGLQGGRFAIAALVADDLVGVVIVGRPVARMLSDGVTAEITRCCVLPSAPLGTPSRLMRAAWRAWSAMGGQRLVTYTLEREPGASLRGAGFALVGCTPAAAWSRDKRRREPRAIELENKRRWEVAA